MNKKIVRRILFVILIIVGIYHSPFKELFYTEKNYFYDTESTKANCLTAIFHVGFLWEHPQLETAGIYLIPYKFKGMLPKKDYIRLNYIGAIDPIYYKWNNDTLYLRIPFWGIIENKLSSKVVVYQEPLFHERWGRYHSDTTRYVKERKEWLQMTQEYRCFGRYDLK